MFLDIDKPKVEELYKIAKRLVHIATNKGVSICTAESCTGGLVGALITSIPGSSSMYTGGVIAYSNTIKENLLSVCPDTIKNYGAVSSHTAEEMAFGIWKKQLNPSYAISVTGIAGPAGGTPDKPVGLVFSTLITSDGTAHTYKFNFTGNREEIRFKTVSKVIEIVLEFLYKEE
ncbi:MAG: CinA family protein [Candidatus Magnetoovum sp. WYHC-5]|nr:CinA family protein [Candidatus Magnetoovum sp. WYHC-5]